MSPVFRGRHTALLDGDFVVFLIGMRVNRLWAVHQWGPVAAAMPRMMAHLLRHPEAGLLHAEYYVYWRGVALVQYWRSYEQLERFARDPALQHLPAWRAFNRAVGANGSVGIWHESYLVRAGQHESLYGNMPPHGLGRAGTLVPAVGARESARQRLGQPGEPAVPSYPTPDGR